MQTKEIRIIIDTDFHKRKNKLELLTWKQILEFGLERAEMLNKKGK